MEYTKGSIAILTREIFNRNSNSNLLSKKQADSINWQLRYAQIVEWCEVCLKGISNINATVYLFFHKKKKKKKYNFQRMDLNINVLIFTKDEVLSVRLHIIDTIDLK